MNNIELSKDLVKIRQEILNHPEYTKMLNIHKMIDDLLNKVQNESLKTIKNPHSD